jgi:hypothetical protein
MQWWVTQVSASSAKVTVTTDGNNPLNVAGPYDSEGAAEKAAAEINAGGGAGTSGAGEAKAIAGLGTGPLNDSLPNPLSGIDRIGAVLEAAYKRVVDGAMWRSLGWILLGLVLIVAGIRMWAGKSPLPAPPAVVPLPV